MPLNKDFSKSLNLSVAKLLCNKIFTILNYTDDLWSDSIEAEGNKLTISCAYLLSIHSGKMKERGD